MSTINETRVKQLESMFRDLARYAGAQERTSLYPGMEVVDASYSSDRILVHGRNGYYECALKVPGVTYNNGDLVCLVYVEGAEPIALWHSPGSSGGIVSGHVIQDEGVDLAQRPRLNFTGAGVTVTDDAVNNRTNVTISGGGGSVDLSGVVTFRGNVVVHNDEVVWL